jgi:bifunctional DNase/RNase
VASEDDKDLRELNEQFRRGMGFGGEGGGEEAVPPEELEARRSRELNEKEVKVVGVYQAPHGGAFVLLRDTRSRNLPIWIDESQAVSISLALGESSGPARPMTHDLMKLLVERLGGAVEYILVDDLYNNVYYAKIALRQGEKTSEIDCRPSDAIAVGVRFKVPIYVADHVLEEGQWPVSEE